jgi:hypothetical protein
MGSLREEEARPLTSLPPEEDTMQDPLLARGGRGREYREGEEGMWRDGSLYYPSQAGPTLRPEEGECTGGGELLPDAHPSLPPNCLPPACSGSSSKSSCSVTATATYLRERRRALFLTACEEES